VTRHGKPLALGERGFAALLLLVERAGEVVTKRELMDAVWPDVVVTDDSLVKAIADVRHALGDTSAAARLVQTVHRRGYRLTAAVSEVGVVAERQVVGPLAAGERTISRPALSFLGAGVVLVTILVVLGVRQLLPVRAAPAGFPFQGLTYRKVAGLPEGAMKPAFSPVGELLALVVPEPADEEHALWLMSPGAERPLRLSRGIDVRGPSPTFSADGSRIYLTTYRHDPERGVLPEMLTVPVLGGEPQPFLSGVSAVTESPDGHTLAYTTVTEAGSALVVRTADGGHTVVAEPAYWPRWSPDGRWIAFTTSNPEGGSGEVFVVRPDGRLRRRLTAETSQIYGLCWTPDSRWIIYASLLHSLGDLWAIPVDGGVQVQVTTGPGQCSAPAVSADGRSLVFAYAVLEAAVYRADAPGASARRLLSEEVIRDIALAPDARTLAVVVGGLSSGRAISLVDVESGQRRSLSGLEASRLRWAPDGRRLLVGAPSPDTSASWIWTVPVDGGLPEPVVRGSATWGSFDLAGDGRRLAAERCAAGRCELVVVDLRDGSEQVLCSGGSQHDVRWSPDGRWIAYTGGDRPQDTLSSGIWVIEAAGGVPRRLAPDGARVAWSPDSKTLLFARFERDSGLWRVGVDAAPPQPVKQPLEDARGFRVEAVELGPGGSPLVTLLTTESAALYELRTDG
jgi:Tol biopolymer transport system component/DNA-binding winged helix-turn-helix (wHTH) protein